MRSHNQFLIATLKGNIHFISPRSDFVWVAGYFESLSSFLQPYNGNICQPLLIGWREDAGHCPGDSKYATATSKTFTQ